MKDVMLWSGLTSFLMSPYTMHGSQADTTRARTLGFSYTGYPELRICSNPPPASLMIPVRSSFDTGGTFVRLSQMTSEVFCAGISGVGEEYRARGSHLRPRFISK